MEDIDLGLPLEYEFYLKPTVEVAQNLLNCLLISETEEGRVVGRISETEAYTQDDPACHAFRGKTQRNAPMFESAGIAYVYLCYGVHYCFNAVTNHEGIGEAVLIRAVEPLVNWELMAKRRGIDPNTAPWNKRDSGSTTLRTRLGNHLCGGPGKLAQAFGISNKQNRVDLTSTTELWIASVQHTGIPKPQIVSSTRIGISAASERLWRFTLQNECFLSKPIPPTKACELEPIS